MICPKCQAPEEELDFWLDSAGIWHWNCFECGYEWEVPHNKMKKEIEEEKNKVKND